MRTAERLVRGGGNGRSGGLGLSRLGLSEGGQRRRSSMRRSHGAIAMRAPEQVHENQLKDDDGDPKQTFPSHSHSPRGEARNDSMQTSAGDSKAGTSEDRTAGCAVVFGPFPGHSRSHGRWAMRSFRRRSGDSWNSCRAHDEST